MTGFRFAARCATFGLMFAAAVAAAPASAQVTSLPGFNPNVPVVPEAADQTLGMALMSAFVTGSGELVNGAGVVEVRKDQITEGRYYITFKRDIRNCTLSAVAASPHVGVIVHGVAWAGYHPDGPEVAWVITWNTSNVSSAQPFSLLVFCAK